MTRYLEIDGTMGEGGGQVLRASLAMSMIMEQPFKISRIRAGRPKPGLKRQHLACIQAAKAVCGAEAEGDEINSQELAFKPGKIKPGEYRFDIGSGGSCTLVLQAILPALLYADGPSSLTVTGGTHVPMAPTFDFFQRTLLPRLEKMGPEIRARLLRPGFMQVGGGIIEVEVKPCRELKPLEAVRTGETLELKGTIKSYGLDENIARREAVIVEKLRSLTSLTVENHKEVVGGGNMVILELVRTSGVTVFSGIAQRGLAAEKVARQATGRLLQFINSKAEIDEYLADQLIVPLALAGGRFITEKFSLHTRTMLDLVPMFTGRPITAAEIGTHKWQIEAPGKY